MTTTPSHSPVAMATTQILPPISSEELLQKAARAQGASFFPARKEAIQSAVRKNRFQRISHKLQAVKAFVGKPGPAKYVWKGTESAVTNVDVRDESPGHEMSEKTLLRLPKVRGNQTQLTHAEIQIYKDTSYQCCDVLGDQTCSKCLKYNRRKQHVRGWGAKFRFAENSVRIKNLLPELTVTEIRERLDCEEFSVMNFMERQKQRRGKFSNPNVRINGPLIFSRSWPGNNANELSSPGSYVIDMGADDSVQLLVPKITNVAKSGEGLEVFKSLKEKCVVPNLTDKTEILDVSNLSTNGKESKTLETRGEQNEKEKALEATDGIKEMETTLGTSPVTPATMNETGPESWRPFRKPRPQSTLRTDYEPIRAYYPAHVIPNVDPPLVDVHCTVDVRFYAGKGKSIE